MIRLLTSMGSIQTVSMPRPGRRRFGVPPGGPFDSPAFRLANALVGRDEESLGWELALASATFIADADGFVATTGAAATVTIASANAGNLAATTNSVIRVCSGDQVSVGFPTAGCRVYVQWGSAGRVGRIDYDLDVASSVGAIAGPDSSLFQIPWPAEFRLSTLMNRVGIRAVADPSLIHAESLPSKPQVVGSGQVTPAGELIIIGPDGPVTGGYPQLLAVGSAWLPQVAQWTPGQSIQIRPCSVEEARSEALRREAILSDRIKEIRAALATPVPRPRIGY